MAYCKYCGKELDKDGNCTCADFQDEHVVKKERIKADEMTEGKAKKTLIIIGIASAVIVIGMLTCLIISGLNAYKSPVKNVVKGINKADTERIISAMYTDDSAAELRVRARDKGISWEDYIKQNDKTIDTILDSRNFKKLKVDFLAKEKLSGSDFTAIEEYFSTNYGEDVKKVYRVEVELTVKYKDSEETLTGWLNVAKIKDDGWKFTTVGSDSFAIINDSITLL